MFQISNVSRETNMHTYKMRAQNYWWLVLIGLKLVFCLIVWYFFAWMCLWSCKSQKTQGVGGGVRGVSGSSRGGISDIPLMAYQISHWHISGMPLTHIRYITEMTTHQSEILCSFIFLICWAIWMYFRYISIYLVLCDVYWSFILDIKKLK